MRIEFLTKFRRFLIALGSVFALLFVLNAPAFAYYNIAMFWRNTSSSSPVITCPTGFITVPANITVGQYYPFCVAQFEMKNDGSSNAVSQATGTPWVSISQGSASTKCAAQGWHLMKNTEWQAIARSVEQVSSNWSGGSVGSGGMYIGNSDSTPALGLSVSSTADPYNQTGNAATDAYGTGKEQKRTLTLSNGQVIWDFAGNVAEWVAGGGYGTNYSPQLTANTEFTNTTYFPTTETGNRTKLGPAGNSYNASKGVGYMNGGSLRIIRGGSFLDGSNSGAFATSFNVNAGYASYTHIGFRCVADATSDLGSLQFTAYPPSDATPGSNFVVQPKVGVYNSSGTLVTTSSAPVTLQAYQDLNCTLPALGTLSATTNPVNASSGIANFAGVQYSTFGTLYLKASSPDLISACSNLISATPSSSGIVFDTSTSGTAATLPVSATITTTGSNELLFATYYSNAICSCEPAAKVTDNAGLTWNVIGDSSFMNGTYMTAWAIASSPLTSKTITVDKGSCNSCLTNPVLLVSGYTGADLAGPLAGGGLGDIPAGFTTLIHEIRTTRANSLPTLMIGLNAVATFSTNATIAAQASAATGASSAQIRATATVPTPNTVSSSTDSWTVGALGITPTYEILAPLTPVSVPTLDSYITGDNGGTSPTATITLGDGTNGFYSTQSANDLLLLVVSWRSNAAMTTPPSGICTSWTSVGSVSQSTTVSTQVWRCSSKSKLNTSSVTVTIPGPVRASAVLASFRGANQTGTQGSGAIDAVSTAIGSTANPSGSVTTLTPNALVLSFLGLATGSTPTAGAGFTVIANQVAAGGAAGTKPSATAVRANSVTATPGAVTVNYTQTAIDWAMVNVAIKP